MVGHYHGKAAAIRNDEFPNGESILSGIKSVVEDAGGTVIFDPTGTSDAAADIVIAVYGEDPYAEFQGDRSNVDFEPNGFDTANLSNYTVRGIPVVSVFLSGRPMWTNPEMNASAAFIAAWLPGAEGGGIADMLFRTNPDFDFTGRLPFSWPADALGAPLNRGDDSYKPLFAYGYGLGYSDTENVGILPETSGLQTDGSSNSDVFFSGGQITKPWSLLAQVNGSDFRFGETPFQADGLSITGTDRTAQEDSFRIDWTSPETDLRISAFNAVDLSRQSNAALELTFYLKNFGDKPVSLDIGMGCISDSPCRVTFPVEVSSTEWTEYRIPLSCFVEGGVDMSRVGEAFYAKVNAPAIIGLSNIRLEPETGTAATCGG